MKKILFIFLFFVLSFTTTFASISISPLKHELSIEVGGTKSATIKVKNNDATAITLYTDKEDFMAGDDSGNPKFMKLEDMENPEASLSNWIEIENSTITLAPGETKEVKFTVKVPEKGDPGGHYGAIFFSPEIPKNSQIAAVQRLGVLVLIDVPGEVKIGGEFSENIIGVPEGEKFNEKSSFDNFPITFLTRFKNTGNTHLKPRGEIELVDENGETLKQIGKEDILSPQGAYIGEKVVDYIPINEGSKNVLPRSDRKFLGTWEGFGYTVLDETTGQKKAKFKNLTEYYADKTAESKKFLKFYETVKEKLVKKPIKANYYLYYEGKDKVKNELRFTKEFFVTYNEKYIGIDNVIISIVVGLIILILVYFIVIAPKNKAKREKKLRKKIMEEMQESKK